MLRSAQLGCEHGRGERREWGGEQEIKEEEEEEQQEEEQQQQEEVARAGKCVDCCGPVPAAVQGEGRRSLWQQLLEL
jgi:hypothetical protein